MNKWGTYEAYARNSDPDTSHAAADAMEDEGHATRLQRLIVDHLKKCGARGATTGEMAVDLGIPRDTLSPRMQTLVRKNRVVETNERRTAPGGTRMQIVWRVSEH